MWWIIGGGIVVIAAWCHIWNKFTKSVDEVYANGGSLARQYKGSDGKYRTEWDHKSFEKSKKS